MPCCNADAPSAKAVRSAAYIGRATLNRVGSWRQRQSHACMQTPCSARKWNQRVLKLRRHTARVQPLQVTAPQRRQRWQRPVGRRPERPDGRRRTISASTRCGCTSECLPFKQLDTLKRTMHRALDHRADERRERPADTLLRENNYSETCALGRRQEKAPRTGPSKCTQVLCKTRLSGCDRQQLPVLGQNDRVDGVHDAVRRSDIPLDDARSIDSHVRCGHCCAQRSALQRGHFS